MVGKNKKTEDPDEEFTTLKQNNYSLAKALTEERLLCKQYLDDRNLLQKKLKAATIMNSRYETIFNQLLILTKDILPSLLTLSSNVPEIIRLVKKGINASKTDFIDEQTSVLKDRSNSPGIQHKTQAVQPMVGGHVIFRPTINLFRINDTNSAENRNFESEDQIASDVMQNNGEITNGLENSYNNENHDLGYLESQNTIRGFTMENFEEENHIEHSNYNMSLLNDEVDANSSEEDKQTLRLETIEECEEFPNIENTSPNISVLKEARILIDPLPMKDVKPLQKKRNFERNEDPLEGPSTLLDDAGDFTNNGYVHKPRLVSKRMFLNYYSDSSDEDISKKKKGTKKKFLTKRKPAIKVENESSHEQKKKKRIYFEEDFSQNQPVVILTQLSEQLVANETVQINNLDEFIKHENCSDISKRSRENSFKVERPKRSRKPPDYTEKSLKCKLRRKT